MITIIHGDDIVSSRNYFLEIKQKGGISFDGKSLNFQDLTQSAKGGDLFSEVKNIFIEDFLGSKKSIAEAEKIIELIKKDTTKINFYFWDGQELSKSSLSQFPNAQIKLFKIPQNIFTFVDGIRPNRPENVKDFHKVLESSDPEAVFYMIIRQFRLLLGLESSIDETKRLLPWQIQKLQKQSKLFTTEQLKEIYRKLFEIDLGYKSGGVTNLTRAIDIFLLAL